jgi:hypothetical protein
VWAEAWCFGDSAAGPGQPPSSGTSYISLIPHSGEDDFRAAFNLTGGDEIDVIDPAGPLPMNVEEYAVVTYDAASTTARLYLNGVQVATASIPTNLAPANYGNTFNNWIGRDEFGGDPMFAGSHGRTADMEWRRFTLVHRCQRDRRAKCRGDKSDAGVGQCRGRQHNHDGRQLPTGHRQRKLFASDQCAGDRRRHQLDQQQPNVLTVNSAGLITAVSAGSATVSATVGGITGTSAAITVSPIQCRRHNRGLLAI